MRNRFPDLERVKAYADSYRSGDQPIHADASAAELRRAFCLSLNEKGLNGAHVIEELIEAASGGLVRNTDPGFFAWVMGASDPVGVAADWLVSIWGQNSAIYQTAPAAAIAEEAVSAWLLDLLDLPKDSSVAFVTGATMAGFVGLAAARGAVLKRYGHDFDEVGLQGAPQVSIYISDDAHVSNFSALRYLGFGRSNIVTVSSDKRGLMMPDALAKELAQHEGPQIIISQAGHINSGGFEDFVAISRLCREHNAWMHVDGAFGLWARVLEEKAELTCGLELADSWSVDGHKWLQLPYDSGFAIVRDPQAHMRAMTKDAGYLNIDPEDGRNPANFGPELSRRARGFAAWAVIRSLGRDGIIEMVRAHCSAATRLRDELSSVSGLSVLNPVDLNQLIIAFEDDKKDVQMPEFARRINQHDGFFVRPAQWKSRQVLRVSIISQFADEALLVRFAEFLGETLIELDAIQSV
ncbi:MAG: pyridoxal-dependent decarboxylase [Pseudomonadota bacterium]